MPLLREQLEGAIKAMTEMSVAQEALTAHSPSLSFDEVKLVDAEGDHVATLRATEEGWELSERAKGKLPPSIYVPGGYAAGFRLTGADAELPWRRA